MDLLTAALAEDGYGPSLTANLYIIHGTAFGASHFH